LPNGSKYRPINEAVPAAVQVSDSMESIFTMIRQDVAAREIARRPDSKRGAEPTSNWVTRMRKRASVNIYLQVFALLSLLIACAVVFGVIIQ
jgi:hypothetical protein